jgi:hypothetical protein
MITLLEVAAGGTNHPLLEVAAGGTNHPLESYCLVYMHHPLYLSLIHGGLTALMHAMQFVQIFDTLTFTLLTSGGIISSRFAYICKASILLQYLPISAYNFI